MPAASRLRVNVFTPALIAGLAVWLAADRINGLAGNDPVVTWPDSSGNARDAASPGGNQPLYKTSVLNGRPVVRFDGVDDYLVTATFGATIAQPTTVVLAAKVASVAGPGSLFDGKGSGRQNLIITPSQWDPWAGNDFLAGTPDTSWHVLTVVFDGASSLMRQDGTQIGSGNLGTLGLDGFTVGAGVNGVGGWLPCDVAEALVYSQALSLADRQTVERHLGNKYAITVA